MSPQAQKRLLSIVSVSCVFIGFVIVPVLFGFWTKTYPERSIGLPLLLVIVNLVVCVIVILAIADRWEALRKLEETKKGEGK